MIRKGLVKTKSVTSLGHQGGRRVFWGAAKFYIDSMYENNAYAYNSFKRWPTIFQGGAKAPMRPSSYGPS